MAGVHDDHRSRMRQRFEDHGLDDFSSLNALELLLFYAIPRKDTNPVAHALLDRFKTLDAVLDASLEDLEQVDGVGHSTAVFLKLIPAVARKYENERSLKRAVIMNTTDAGEYLVPKYLYEDAERIYLVTLDSGNRILGCRKVGEGVVNAAETSTRLIVEAAVKDHAAAVILSHNHPSGNCRPSQEDLDMTRQLYRTLSMIGIPLLDHVIVAGREYCSLADEGFLADCADE